jgi:hypothetical protein
MFHLVSGACNAEYQCNITVAGSISNLLVDGNNYTTSSSVAAWCDGGRCYGAANAPVTATAPFVITIGCQKSVRAMRLGHQHHYYCKLQSYATL